MTETDIDAALTRRLAVDHREAFHDYVEEFQHGIYTGLRRMTGSSADAEDLAQETFVRAFKAFEKYDSSRIRTLKLRGWTWTIALNLARNAARTRSRRPVTVATAWEHPERADDHERFIESDVWSQRLAEISGPQRTAVVLRHVIGLSYDQIAEATGRAIGTVKTDVHRGIGRLQTIIDEETS